MNNLICQVQRLGLVDYQDAWDLQRRLAAEIATGQRPATLLLLEHPHTFTFGRRGHSENLLWSPAEQAQHGVKVYWVDRGGDVTYHGPGQLVGYPLLPLGPVKITATGNGRLPQADYMGYLRRLEQVLIQALAVLGLPGCQALEGLTGVWLPPRQAAQPPAKIAAIGVKVNAQGISQHGFALNVQPDMSYWQGIIGCGLADYPVTSLAEQMPAPPKMQSVMAVLSEVFSSVFEYQMVELD